MFNLNNTTIGIIGLGYVGLPLAVEFSKKYPVLGFDINSQRIQQLKSAHDITLEVSNDELNQATQLQFTDKLADLAVCNVYIVTVPTPINRHKQPDLGPLLKASEYIGQILKINDVVIYESTVYPGATEEDCVPVLERESSLVLNKDFYVGYSPERINPGDKEHRVTNILKVIAGSTPEVTNYMDELYGSIIVAGTHKTSSIRVAEAAKVIENTQRDVNIALINELALLFNRLGINTEEVLQAAGTKWNFLPFRPGLVGGHCIGVDPYYLTHKAQAIGYNPEIILSGRRINDAMGKHVASQVIKLMLKKHIHVHGSKVLIMGLTFKEDCPDLRNTRVINIIEEMQEYGAEVHVYDPWVNKQEAKKVFGIEPIEALSEGQYDAIILAVAHQEFKQMSATQIQALGKQNTVLFDIKYLLPADLVDGRL